MPRALGLRPQHSPRRRALALCVPLALGLLLGVTSSAWGTAIVPEHGGSPNADDISTLYELILAVAIIVFVGVEATLFYSLWKFRARKGAVPAQIRGNTRLEVGWTVGAAVILVVLAVFTFAKLSSIRNPPNSGANGLRVANGALLAAGPSKRLPPNGKRLEICVNGQQYIWRFTYPVSDDCTKIVPTDPYSYETMVAPVDTTVVLTIRAQDVAHSWWVPKLGGKFDAVPGYTNYTWFKIPGDKAGQAFSGQCAELCGRNHANMTAEVKAVTPSQYDAFIARKKAELSAADSAAAKERQVIQSGGTP
jgi:cytochrome c oxidase subunit 2